ADASWITSLTSRQPPVYKPARHRVHIPGIQTVKPVKGRSGPAAVFGQSYWWGRCIFGTPRRCPSRLDGCSFWRLLPPSLHAEEDRVHGSEEGTRRPKPRF